MKAANPRILTINACSSSIKFALFEVGDHLKRVFGVGAIPSGECVSIAPNAR